MSIAITQPRSGAAPRQTRAQLQASRTKLKALPTFIAFDVGVAHVFRVYAGGHEQSLWQRYAAPWLTLALNHLAPAAG